MPLLQRGVAMAAGRLPKIIKPQAHAVLDYAVAGSFLIKGALYWRRNKRAAMSSLFCGSLAMLNNVLTDYPGGISKVISFRTHGSLDAGIAGMAAAMPSLMGFAGEREARFFTRQSIAGTAITAMTDFDYYERPSDADEAGDREEKPA